MKRRGGEPATKDDLSRELKGFATKDDLLSLHRSIQKDIQTLGVSLQRNIQALEGSMRSEFQSHARVIRNTAVEVSGLKAANKELREDFSASSVRLESRLLDRMDGFMAKTVKVDRDQFWLIHRMDKIEERVTRIEKRAS